MLICCGTTLVVASPGKIFPSYKAVLVVDRSRVDKKIDEVVLPFSTNNAITNNEAREQQQVPRAESYWGITVVMGDGGVVSGVPVCLGACVSNTYVRTYVPDNYVSAQLLVWQPLRSPYCRSVRRNVKMVVGW